MNRKSLHPYNLYLIYCYTDSMWAANEWLERMVQTGLVGLKPLA